MSYGIDFKGTNGQLIFDTTESSAEVLNPYYFNSQGALVSGSNTTSSAITVSSSDLLFVRVNSGNLRGTMTYSGSNRTFTPVQSTSYFIARKSTAVTSNIVSGNYGLEIYNSSGTATTFSTRKADSAINVNYIYDDQEVTHNQQIWSQSTTNVFVSLGFMFFNSGSGTFGCFNYGSSSITYDSFLNLGQFGSVSLPNFGSLIIASLRG